MRKQTLLIIGLIGGILAVVGVFLPWISVDGGETWKESGWDLKDLRLLGITSPYLVLAGGIIALLGSLILLKARGLIGFLLPMGGIIAIIGGIRGYFDANAIWSGGIPDIIIPTSANYGVYVCIIGGVLALVGGITERMVTLKLNVLCVISAILAFISLALPWWVLTADGMPLSIFPWGISHGWLGPMHYAFVFYSALALIVTSGILALISSARAGSKKMLSAGILALLSLVTFIGGLESLILTKFPRVNSPFYWGPYDGGLQAFAYLSSGFWLALVAAIIAFVAYKKYTQSI